MKHMKRQHVGLYLAAISVALVSNSALAQSNLDPDERGPEICVPTTVAQSAPGLYGSPTWPAGENVAPAGQVRGDVYDPRWGSAPRLSFVYDGRLEGHSRYRILRDQAANELVVSIQIHDDLTTDGATGADKVYFGIAGEAGDLAVAIVIPVFGADDPTTTSLTESTRGQFIKPDWANTRYYTYQQTRATPWDSGTPVLTVSGSTSTVTLPPWIKDVRLWNSNSFKAENGGAWSVQFRVVLSAIPLDITERARLNFGARVADANPFAVVRHAVPNTTTGCLPNSGVDPATYDGHCDLVVDNLFFPKPSQWTITKALNTVCTGIDIEARNLFTTHPSANNLVRILNNQSNEFRIKPTFDQPVAADQLQARLRIANWGSVADPQAGWFTLHGRNDAACTDTDPTTICPDSLGITNSSDIASGASVELGYDCTNFVDANGNGQNICDLDLNTSVHQCIQAELSPAPGVPLTFKRATAWNNMHFTTASEVTETATISAVGLQNILHNANGRDVYLHVVTYNMPTAGSEPMEDDVDSLESLRSQIEPNYDGGDFCEHRTDLCVPVDSDLSGVCIYESVDYECGAQEQPLELEDATFCITSEACTPVPNGGYNPLLTSMDRDQVLTTYYPTIIVYPYYDSGRTEMVDGQARKLLMPMYSFGLHVTHEGEFFGWLNGLSGGANLSQLRPDLFLLRMSNESRQNIDVHLSAEEQEHYAPFSQIAGSATTLGWGFDTVNITGITAAVPLDLRKASAMVEKVLFSNTEHVQSLRSPRPLSRLAGATAVSASFQSTGSSPYVRMDVIDLPIIGRTINMTVTGARVSRPSSCGFFGTAMLTTAFRINSGSVSQPISGEDQWSCVPTTLFNY